MSTAPEQHHEENIEEESPSEEEEEQTEEQKMEVMKQQEAKFAQKSGGKYPQMKQKGLIRKDRKFFDSADYQLAGKSKTATTGEKLEPVPTIMKTEGIKSINPHHTDGSHTTHPQPEQK